MVLPLRIPPDREEVVGLTLSRSTIAKHEKRTIFYSSRIAGHRILELIKGTSGDE